MKKIKVTQLIIDGLMLTLFLALLALPFSAFGLFGTKTDTTDLPVLGDSSDRNVVERPSDSNVPPAQNFFEVLESTESTDTFE